MIVRAAALDAAVFNRASIDRQTSLVRKKWPLRTLSPFSAMDTMFCL
jgi:hypothetical protein